MIKASQPHPAFGLPVVVVGGVSVASLYAWNEKNCGESSGRNLSFAFLPAALLASHLIAWTQSARWTHAANATLIVCMVPVVIGRAPAEAASPPEVWRPVFWSNPLITQMGGRSKTERLNAEDGYFQAAKTVSGEALLEPWPSAGREFAKLKVPNSWICRCRMLY